jgi:putative sigma-54 modulation protein
MNVEVKGVHYDVSHATREYIEKKIHRVDFAKDLIVDLLFTLTREKKGYKVECNVNFRWGSSAHVRVATFELFKAIDLLFDKLDSKIHKEKGKIQEHSA